MSFLPFQGSSFRAVGGRVGGTCEPTYGRQLTVSVHYLTACSVRASCERCRCEDPIYATFRMGRRCSAPLQTRRVRPVGFYTSGIRWRQQGAVGAFLPHTFKTSPDDGRQGKGRPSSIHPESYG